MLNAQLANLKNQNEEMSKATAETEKKKNAAEMGRFFDEETIKANKAILDIQVAIDQLTMTTGEKSIDNIRKQIIAEQELAQKKLQSKLAVGETLDPAKVKESNDKIAASYQPVIDKQTTLNEKSREFSTGWKSAFAAYVDDATNAANQGKAIFDVMTNAMNSAIDEFVMKGTFSFKSFSIGIIQELEKIALKAAAAQVFKASGIGDLFGAVGKTASGGTIPSGTFSLVGENGPELVKGPASVTNAPTTADMMGGGQTIINNNVSAIDAKSVAQLFAENRMMLFGNVEQARRELPMRTR